MFTHGMQPTTRLFEPRLARISEGWPGQASRSSMEAGRERNGIARQRTAEQTPAPASARILLLVTGEGPRFISRPTSTADGARFRHS